MVNKNFKEGIIFNIQQFSIHDGPGIRTTVFLKGCPLSCKWCSNPESQNPKIELFLEEKENKSKKIIIHNIEDFKIDKDKNIIIDENFRKKFALEDKSILKSRQEGRYMSSSEVLEICLKDKDFYLESGGGVTISGGEASLQIDFLKDLLKKLKEKNIHTAIETSLFTSRKNLNKILAYLDLVIFDIKDWNPKRHKKFTGVDNDIILENVKFLIENKKEILARIPVIPNFNYSKEDAKEFANLFYKLGIKKVELLPFHQMGEAKYQRLGRSYAYKGVNQLSEKDMEIFIEEFQKKKIEAYV